MTAPGGTESDLQIPSPVDNSPPGSAGGWPPWPPIPSPPFHTYIGSSLHWEVDPYAPPIIQDGELLLGEYDEGTSFLFTVTVLDGVRGSPIAGASVTVLNAGDDTPATTGFSNGDGKAILTLEAGGDYYIKVESTDHFPQVSDEFQLLGNHLWTMILTPGKANGDGLSRIVLGIGILLLLISLIFFLIGRRRQSP